MDCRDIERVIKTIVGTTCGVCTDNTSANQGAWKILEAKFPTKFFYGCVSHGLRLLVKSIFAPPKTKRGSAVATYPEGYPFATLAQFTINCREVVSFFHNSHALKARLEKEQSNMKLPFLVSPAPTRWGIIGQCFRHLLLSEKIIYSIVNARDFVIGPKKHRQIRQNIKELVSDMNFVDTLRKCLLIISPIDKWITIFQNDGVPVSEVYHAFTNLPDDFRAIANLTETELQYLCHVTDERFNFMYGDAHGVAYLLDPKYVGEGISDVLFKRKLEDFIISFPVDDVNTARESHKEQLYQEITDYTISAQSEKDARTFRFKMLESRKKTPMQYWLTDGCRWRALKSSQ